MTRRRVPTEATARAAIEREGVLLVYPVANRDEPRSLWSVLYPGEEMRWAWDEGADERVVYLWHLREQLARSHAVVYSKWYKGRAVFFSHSLFTAMLAQAHPMRTLLSTESRALLQMLEDDSPQSTKALRREAGLRGRENEGVWTRSMRALWEQLLIVGTGEIDDGAFPSLAVGATRSIFEELCEAAKTLPLETKHALLARHLPASHAFGKHFRRTLSAPETGLAAPRG